MSADINATVTATAAAVTGEGTPDAVRVTRPAASTVLSLFIALAVCCLMSAGVILVLTYAPWGEGTDAPRIKYIGWMGLAAVACIPLIVFALASPWVGQVKATAGPVSIDATGR